MGTPEGENQVVKEPVQAANDLLQKLMMGSSQEFNLSEDLKLVFQPMRSQFAEVPVVAAVLIEDGVTSEVVTNELRMVDEALVVFLRKAIESVDSGSVSAKDLNDAISSYVQDSDFEVDAGTYKAQSIFNQLSTLGTAFMFLGGDVVMTFTKKKDEDSCLVSFGKRTESIELDLNEDLISAFVSGMRAAEKQAFRYCVNQTQDTRSRVFRRFMEVAIEQFNEVMQTSDDVGSEVKDIVLVEN